MHSVHLSLASVLSWSSGMVDECPSLIDCSLDDFFAVADLDEISREQFEEVWTKGVDTPFWFVR